MQDNKTALSLATKLGYGVGDLGANLVFTAVNFYLMYFLTDISLLSASLAGVAMMAVRLVDACTDPLIGHLSDRTRTRWGRRRPYILFGSFFVGAAFVLLFTRIDIGSSAGRFAYFTLVYLIFFVAYSVVNVPYSALTPDIATDYHARTDLVGYRMAFAIIGSLIAAGATKMLTGRFADEAAGFHAMACLYGSVFIVLSAVVFLSVRERPSAIASPDGGSALRLYVAAGKNRPFLLAALTYILHTLAVVIMSSTMVYYFKYYIRQENHLGPIFLTLLGVAVMGIPLWVMISRKIGKKLAYNVGMLIFAGAMVAIFFLSADQLPMLYTLTALAGLGFSTFFVLPWAIVPDTIEYHEFVTGQRNEGIFYGIWSFGPKLGSAAASLCVGLALAHCGYIPNAALQPARALFGIRVVLSIVPAAIIVLGVVVMSFYPLSPARYEQIVSALKQGHRAAIKRP